MTSVLHSRVHSWDVKQQDLLFLRSWALFGSAVIDGHQPQTRCMVSISIFDLLWPTSLLVLVLPLMTFFYRDQCNRTPLITKGLISDRKRGKFVIYNTARKFDVTWDVQASIISSKELLGRLDARVSVVAVRLFFSAVTHPHPDDLIDAGFQKWIRSKTPPLNERIEKWRVTEKYIFLPFLIFQFPWWSTPMDVRQGLTKNYKMFFFSIADVWLLDWVPRWPRLSHQVVKSINRDLFDLPVLVQRTGSSETNLVEDLASHSRPKTMCKIYPNQN